MNKSLQSSYPDQTRNLNPTLPARVAMIIYGKEYSEQHGGSMDFWDSLSPLQQKRCLLVTQLYYDMAMGVIGEYEMSEQLAAKLGRQGKASDFDRIAGKDWARREQRQRLKQQTGL